MKIKLLVITFLILIPSTVVNGMDIGMDKINGTGLETDETAKKVIVRVINTLLTFLGLISVVLILTGGFKWMTSMGNKDKIDEAKKLIKNSIIGLAVILFSYAITNFVITGLIG